MANFAARLRSTFIQYKQKIYSVMDLMQDIIARAKANKQRIVLPEGTEERTLKAADRLVADGVADII